MTTIEVRDGRGNVTSAEKCLFTGNVIVTMPNSKPFMIDPKDPDAISWLTRVFGKQLDFILTKEERV